MKYSSPVKNLTKNKALKDVDSYLAGLPDEQRIALEKLRKTILAAAPDAIETISYRMPAYKYKGMLVFFAAFKNHCSLFAAGKSVMKRFSKELEPFDTRKGTIHFQPDKPLPASLVRKIVKARMKENDERKKAK